MTATGPGGGATSQIAIKVTPPPPAPEEPDDSPIKLFLASANDIARGQQVTLCYSLDGAVHAELSPPPGHEVEPVTRCITVTPEHTTTYTLMVVSQNGQKYTRQLTVRVK